MRKLVITLVIAALTVSVTVTAAVAKPTKKNGGSADICVLLPDPKSSVRWETQDRPGFVAAFKKAKVSYVITNANGDRPEAEDAGRPVPCERREGRHPDLARQGLLDRDRGGGQVEEREGDRVRPPGDRRHRRDLHLVGRQSGRRPAGQGCRRRPEGERQVLEEAGRGGAARWPDRQQLVPLQGRLRVRPEPALQERDVQEGPAAVHAGLGQPEGVERSSSRCSSRRATRSTRSQRPTTASRTQSSLL